MLPVVASPAASMDGHFEQPLAAPIRNEKKNKDEVPVDALFVPEEEGAVHPRYGDRDQLDREQETTHDSVWSRRTEDEGKAEEFRLLRRRALPRWEQQCEEQASHHGVENLQIELFIDWMLASMGTGCR